MNEFKPSAALMITILGGLGILLSILISTSGSFALHGLTETHKEIVDIGNLREKITSVQGALLSLSQKK